jgi:hypothetical protein
LTLVPEYSTAKACYFNPVSVPLIGIAAKAVGVRRTRGAPHVLRLSPITRCINQCVQEG